MKAQYNYLSDGTKVSVRDGSGKNGYDYVGSVVYKVVDGRREFDRALVGDVHITNEGVRYALTDQLGSVRALIDEDGNVVQQSDYYPFGAKIARDDYVNSDDNRFLLSGKESQELLDLNAYDFGARMYDASLGRWNTVDPLGEKYTNLSPYNYCVNNPLVYVDPNGKDVMITIVGNTITITANIFIYGKYASDELATLYMMDIQQKWGQLKTFVFEGSIFDILWDINVEYRSDVKDKDDFVFNGINNYLKIKEEGDISASEIVNSHSGTIRQPSDDMGNPMSHEFGHIMGLSDKYNPVNGNPISRNWEHNVMVDINDKASEKNLNILLSKPIFLDKMLNMGRKSRRPISSFDDGRAKTIYHVNVKNRER